MNLRGMIATTLGAMIVGFGASAADLPVQAMPLTPAPLMTSWTGFYLGGSLGLRSTNASWRTVCLELPCNPAIVPLFGANNPSNYDSTSARAGLYAGYNWQFAPQWLTGLEADIAWGGAKARKAGIPSGAFLPLPADATSVKTGWDGSVRARLGYLITPAMLLYATGGVAWQQVEASASCNGNLGAWCDVGALRSETSSAVKAGWTVGAGAEAMLWSNWIARLEYRYSDFQSFRHTFFATTAQCVSNPGSICDAVGIRLPLKTHTISIGLAYKF